MSEKRERLMQKLMEYGYTDEQIEEVLLEKPPVSSLGPPKAEYGVFERYLPGASDGEAEVTLVKTFAGRDPEKIQDRAKRAAKIMMSDRSSEERRYRKFVVKKISNKMKNSDEYKLEREVQQYKQGLSNILAEAEEYNVDVSVSTLRKFARDVIKENNLTASDLQAWDWDNFELSEGDYDESINMSARASVRSRTYKGTIKLRGVKYESPVRETSVVGLTS